MNCTRCNQPGAGSTYNGGTYHLSCKLEQKLDDGKLPPTGGKPTQPRLRGTGGDTRRKR